MNVTATLIGQMIVFSILVWFVKSVLWEPMLKVLEDRKARIADGLAAAEKGKHEEELARQHALDPRYPVHVHPEGRPGRQDAGAGRADGPYAEAGSPGRDL